ncbi:MAG: type II toxin-antitoxin system Phd/YefM family antitoxin [Thermoleophilia bacterium]|nr:type II toxin-antitoxin system Phd/YefM family antitoxin [Thermoleophilia bacterium]
MAESIGVRELRQHASRWLERVQQGESFTVTERGKPIARLCPLSEGAKDWRQDWIERGLMSPATKPASIILESQPVVIGPATPSTKEILDDLRRDFDEPSRPDA